MYPWSLEFKGRLETHTFESHILRENVLRDPYQRPLWVYLPPGYDEEPERRYPTIYMLLGLTGQLDMWRNRSPFRKHPVELADELFANPDIPPCILVWVDCWTSYGGSQYLDSPAVGRYHTYLCDEIVPWIDEHYRTLSAREHRGISGKSSGGYGAFISSVLRPDLWGAFATHSGDALFEYYQLLFPQVVRALRDHYEGSYELFWHDFRSRVAFTKESDAALLEVWCMAACYSADEDGTIHLPFHPATGELRPEIWERWLAYDPVRLVAKHAHTFRTMQAIYIDAGRADQYYLDLGAEALRRELQGIGVTDIFFELFDGTHIGIEYRYPFSWEYLAKRLA
uniref:Enterochelin esterase n=1 Tax=Thermosporothrix sp. COM3 TaxID=2490863 RepID=A0A455SG28_9CHLR|nr:enterochelin esterase [Thermosporothrix sp. COM3]